MKLALTLSTRQNGTATQINPNGSTTRLRLSGPQDKPDTTKQLPLTDGSSVTVTPDRRTTSGRAVERRSAALESLTGGNLITKLRNLGQEQAEEIYNDLIVPRSPAEVSAKFKKALIDAYPALRDKYSAVEAPVRLAAASAIEPIRDIPIDISGAQPDVLGAAVYQRTAQKVPSHSLQPSHFLLHLVESLKQLRKIKLKLGCLALGCKKLIMASSG